MSQKEYVIDYPRRRLARGAARLLGRLALPILFRIQIRGKENFPDGGPLLVVGNHVAVMEAVLMAVFTPWPVEMLGSSDIPHEKVTDLVANFYGSIPVNRGHVDRAAMRKALDVLKQDGTLAIFPEGGIWQGGSGRARTGVAWLSHRTQSPVLPVYFGGTLGALGGALELKRPRLTMHVGKPIPAANLPQGAARKEYLEAYASRVMDAVNALCPPEDRPSRHQIVDERFELRVTALTSDGRETEHPSDLIVHHRSALARLLHQPAVLKIFKNNLRLPVGPLQNLDSVRDAQRIVVAAQAILNYLEGENPYLLTYRFGPKAGRAMQSGLEELLDLARWAARSGLALAVTPIRRYFSPAAGKEIVQIEQGAFEHWM